MKNTDEFPLQDDRIYLNYAANSPWPQRTLMAIERLSKKMNAGIISYRDWMQAEENLREQLRQFIDAPSVEDIALLKNTSEGLSIVAHGLDWKSKDNVVITDQEFPSNRIVWQSLENQGVVVREAAIHGKASEGESPEAIIEHCCDEHTRLIAVSSVQYATGLRMNLDRIGRFCRERNILFCVDAIQSLGAIPMDVQAIGADFLVADGHKWMLGPEGVAVFYCRRELRHELRLHQYGWHMVEDLLDFDAKDWKISESARRFECGSLNTLGIYALSASLSLLMETGMEAVSKGVLQNTAYLLDAITGSKKLSLVSPAIIVNNPARRSGIVTFRASTDPSQLFKKLIASGIICSLRGGGIRFSPHFYTPIKKLEAAMEQVEYLA
uniref:Selenocysteine lyase/Cysteine desulfurase n=1 Tax=Candidatus Kentrum sp. TUN TaxID=2126343 RepID=A0A450ZRS6_9GAMM|nr:MAG: Selenocysteine lyase/Cysteine desulfurase [Candidatus Kentron sp. TUN]